MDWRRTDSSTCLGGGVWRDIFAAPSYLPWYIVLAQTHAFRTDMMLARAPINKRRPAAVSSSCSPPERNPRGAPRLSAKHGVMEISFMEGQVTLDDRSYQRLAHETEAGSTESTAVWGTHAVDHGLRGEGGGLVRSRYPGGPGFPNAPWPSVSPAVGLRAREHVWEISDVRRRLQRSSPPRSSPAEGSVPLPRPIPRVELSPALLLFAKQNAGSSCDRFDRSGVRSAVERSRPVESWRRARSVSCGADFPRWQKGLKTGRKQVWEDQDEA